MLCCEKPEINRSEFVEKSVNSLSFIYDFSHRALTSLQIKKAKIGSLKNPIEVKFSMIFKTDDFHKISVRSQSFLTPSSGDRGTERDRYRDDFYKS